MFKTKIFLASLFFLLTNSLKAQYEAGNGVVKITFIENMQLDFYVAKEDAAPAKTIKFSVDPTTKKVVIQDLENVKQWLNPEELSIDYSYLSFRCTYVREDWLKVLINSDNADKYWIKRNDDQEYKDWAKLFTEARGVSRLATSKQKIRKGPSDNANSIDYAGTECFKVISVEGDWLQITSSGTCHGITGDSDEKLDTGWIRWKKGYNVMVQYYNRL